MQGQAPVGRVRHRLHGQSADHAVRRRQRRRPVVRRIRTDDGADSGLQRVRCQQTGGHGPPDQVIGCAVQQTQATARVPVRVQLGHLCAGQRRPVPPTQEHGRHTANLQGSVVCISGNIVIQYAILYTFRRDSLYNAQLTIHLKLFFV